MDWKEMSVQNRFDRGKYKRILIFMGMNARQRNNIKKKKNQLPEFCTTRA